MKKEIQGDTGEFVADTGTSVKYPLRYGKIQGTSREIRKVSRRYSTVRELDGDIGESEKETIEICGRHKGIRGGLVGSREIWEDILTRRYQRRYKEIQKRHWEIQKRVQGDPCDTGESERDTGYPEKIQGGAE
jgi:hypothetical protein